MSDENEGYENITPKVATKYLNANTLNRPLKPGHVERLASDMKAGAWTKCLAPIAFYEDGSLADGQHRLWAIVESGVTVRFRVVRELPKEAGVNIDTGIIRTVVDVARLQGVDSNANTQVAAVARGVEDGMGTSGRRSVRSVSEQLGVLARHSIAAHWATTHGPVGRGIRNAPVLSSIARAWYIEQDHERLAQFGKVLGKGFLQGPGDEAAVALRNYLLMKSQSGISTSSTKIWRDTFLKAQHAIHCFMRRKSLTMIKTITDEMYPLLDGNAPVPTTQKGRAAVVRAKKAAKRK